MGDGYKWVCDSSFAKENDFGEKAQEEKKQIIDSARNADLSCPRTVTSSLLLED